MLLTAVRIDYRLLGEALNRAGVIPAPAELHGEICGVMCSGGVAASGQWLEESMKECESGTLAWEEASERLRDLQADTWRMLSGGEMAFEPLLPDEQWPLAEQVQALALWCHGFLTGLGVGGFASNVTSSVSGDLDEIMADFAEISRAGVGSEEGRAPEESEFALAEVKEYVRVSVQIVFEELEGTRRARQKGSLH